MKKEWRFLDTGENRGILNMAIDKAILNAKALELTPPTLRVFRWSPPAVSLGRLQNTQGVNLEKCQELGIDVVKRPTGAGAVLHKEELTYSVIASEKDGMPHFFRASHEIINQGLIEAYKILGVEIDLITASEQNIPYLCLLGSGLTNLTYQGKKLIVSVWMRKGDAVLQHGSLIIKHDFQLLSSIFRVSPEVLKEKIISLSEIIPDITWQDVKSALIRGFQKALGIKFFEGKLALEEVNDAQRISSMVKNGYSNRENLI